MPSSSGSINLLDQLTELRETFYGLAYWFIIKENNAGAAKWKRYKGQVIWERGRAALSSLGSSFSPYLHMLTNPGAL